MFDISEPNNHVFVYVVLHLKWNTCRSLWYKAGWLTYISFAGGGSVYLHVARVDRNLAADVVWQEGSLKNCTWFINIVIRSMQDVWIANYWYWQEQLLYLLCCANKMFKVLALWKSVVLQLIKPIINPDKNLSVQYVCVNAWKREICSSWVCRNGFLRLAKKTAMNCPFVCSLAHVTRSNDNRCVRMQALTAWTGGMNAGSRNSNSSSCSGRRGEGDGSGWQVTSCKTFIRGWGVARDLLASCRGSRRVQLYIARSLIIWCLLPVKLLAFPFFERGGTEWFPVQFLTTPRQSKFVSSAYDNEFNRLIWRIWP